MTVSDEQLKALDARMLPSENVKESLSMLMDEMVRQLDFGISEAMAAGCNSGHLAALNEFDAALKMHRFALQDSLVAGTPAAMMQHPLGVAGAESRTIGPDSAPPLVSRFARRPDESDADYEARTKEAPDKPVSTTEFTKAHPDLEAATKAGADAKKAAEPKPAVAPDYPGQPSVMAPVRNPGESEADYQARIKAQKVPMGKTRGDS